MSEEVLILKGDILESALKRASLSGSLFNPDTVTQELGLMLLEETALSLQAQNCPLGWKKSEYWPEVNPSAGDDSGIKDFMMKGLSSKLAVELLASIGMQPNPYLIQCEEDGMRAIWRQVEVVQPKSFNLPLGSAQGRRIFDNTTNSRLIQSDNESYLGDLEV
jgi:hypothetical protein